MAFLTPDERRFAEAISRLVYGNPFLPERIEHEKQALGEDFVDAPMVWSLQPSDLAERDNIVRLIERVTPLAAKLRDALAGGRRPTPRELELYEDLVLYMLYQRFRGEFNGTITRALEGRAPGPISYWKTFRAEFAHALELPGTTLPSGYRPEHLFACFYQIRRAFHRIFLGLVGGSLAAARLRAAVWQSIFTHDMKRYARVLYRHMGDITTLVTGPSGTGKELVARAVGESRYIPFDASSECFAADFLSTFFTLNLSALSPTLIESELFGHKRGSFTGAVSDRVGWLEVCPALGSVFLDEIGELDPAIQVKLLRILQTRTFQRLGETADRSFGGKIIAATNRDLAESLRSGAFREDFYYRICSDIITTSSLAEQLAENPDDLGNLVLFIARRLVGDEAEHVTAEVVDWVDRHLGRAYTWPGNIRGLEQCVCNVLIHQRYEPTRWERLDPGRALLEDMRAGRLTADELLRRYCTMTYARAGSYEEAARRLGLDRRTVKSKVDRDRLAATETTA